ncbi:MAG: hypothetical protein NTX45_08395 [Proteobacteria bacterium]|nr:hypothetical protein [Pseudomonadota bacterium]
MEQTDTVLFHWDLIEGTAFLLGELIRFGSPVTLVTEPGGTYGGALRHPCRQAGFVAKLARPCSSA